jgi:hypothetical protein
VHFLAGLIIRIVVFGVVDVADIEGEVSPCLRIQISEREIGVEAPAVSNLPDTACQIGSIPLKMVTEFTAFRFCHQFMKLLPADLEVV